MLKVGIVGKNHSKSYISLINDCNYYELVGVFDPCFQFKTPKDFNQNLIYLSFEELIKQSEAIIFASPEKIYLPLIEMALKYSRPVFLHSINNLSYQEQVQLMKLREEAGGVLQIQQPIIFHNTFQQFINLSKKPLLLTYNYSNASEKKLLLKTRLIIGAVLSVFKTNLKKVTVNTISAFNEMPDIIKIRIDFDNGSVAEIIVNAIEKQNINHVKCFEYNGFFDLDLIENSLVGQLNNNKVQHNTPIVDNTIQKIIGEQLSNFYFNVTNHKTPKNSIENEIVTQKVIEKVKEKLRISINIF